MQEIDDIDSIRTANSDSYVTKDQSSLKRTSPKQREVTDSKTLEKFHETLGKVMCI